MTTVEQLREELERHSVCIDPISGVERDKCDLTVFKADLRALLEAGEETEKMLNRLQWTGWDAGEQGAFTACPVECCATPEGFPHDPNCDIGKMLTSLRSLGFGGKV